MHALITMVLGENKDEGRRFVVKSRQLGRQITFKGVNKALCLMVFDQYLENCPLDG